MRIRDFTPASSAVAPMRVDPGGATLAGMAETRYRFVEHVGEVELRLEAPTERGIFEAAAEALAELVSTTKGEEAASHEIALEAVDRARLLVAWLEELVFLAEVERFVPDHVVWLELNARRLRAVVEGHRDRPRHLVKGATLHDLELGRWEGAWHGRVVLDV
jgi:SHS2 domain-containing protein